jgi:hypothetical protein
VVFLDSVVTQVSAAHLQANSAAAPEKAGIIRELQALLQEASHPLLVSTSVYFRNVLPNKTSLSIPSGMGSLKGSVAVHLLSVISLSGRQPIPIMLLRSCDTASLHDAEMNVSIRFKLLPWTTFRHLSHHPVKV